MKKLILLFALVGCYFFSDAQYVIKKMSEYPAKVGTPPGVDYALFNDSGATKRVTINQICTACGAASATDSAIFATRRYVDSLNALGTKTYTFNTTGGTSTYTIAPVNGKTIDAVTIGADNLIPAQYSKSGSAFTFVGFTIITTYCSIFYH